VVVAHFGRSFETASFRRGHERVASSSLPTPPFTECPQVDQDTSCQISIVVTSTGVEVLGDMSQGPYDGSDDALIGIVNSTDMPLTSLSLSADIESSTSIATGSVVPMGSLRTAR
jgi:hypothetical protein